MRVLSFPVSDRGDDVRNSVRSDIGLDGEWNNEFMGAHPEANLMELISFRSEDLMVGLFTGLGGVRVAGGSIYINGQEMVHGGSQGGAFLTTKPARLLYRVYLSNFKANVLIDQTGHARLADFDLLGRLGPELTASERFGL